MPDKKGKKEPGNATRASVRKEREKPCMAKSARIAELNLDIARIPEQPSVTMTGTVDKIIPSPRPSQPEKAQIAVEGADRQKQDLRIENALTDEHGDDVSLEQTLSQNEQVQSTVAKCGQELSEVNVRLRGEITERKNLESELSESLLAEEEARRRSLHDEVTGLPNRALLRDRLEHALAQAKRLSLSLSLLFIDLDDFKKVNDSHGHEVGDKVLRAIAERLQSSVRADDTVGRQGGDEFVYLALDLEKETNAENIAKKIRNTIAATCEIEGVPFTVKASIGIAIYPQDGRTPEELLKSADEAMYKAKAKETGYCFFHELSAS
jgi:diguanylate cyclase (GGDEF)-like protein